MRFNDGPSLKADIVVVVATGWVLSPRELVPCIHIMLGRYDDARFVIWDLFFGAVPQDDALQI